MLKEKKQGGMHLEDHHEEKSSRQNAMVWEQASEIYTVGASIGKTRQTIPPVKNGGMQPRSYPIAFGLKVQKILPKLVSSNNGCFKVPPAPPGGWNVPLLFQRMNFGRDNWSEARLLEACRYVRGCKNLEVPHRWKRVFPQELSGDEG